MFPGNVQDLGSWLGMSRVLAETRGRARTWGRMEPSGRSWAQGMLTKVMKDPLCNESTWIFGGKHWILKESKWGWRGFVFQSDPVEIKNFVGSWGKYQRDKCKANKMREDLKPWADIPKERHWVPLPKLITGRNEEKTLRGKFHH